MGSCMSGLLIIRPGILLFDLVSLYHGLQLQLMIYMDGALTVEQNKHKDKDVIPAGVFYYNIKDPMIQEKIDADIETVQEKVLKELKMNGLVLKDKELVQKNGQFPCVNSRIF